MMGSRYGGGIGSLILPFALIFLAATAQKVCAQGTPADHGRTIAFGSGTRLVASDADAPGARHQLPSIGAASTCNADADRYAGMPGEELVESTFLPLYKVIAILYAPPGNRSSQTYGTTPTSGASTAIGNSFTFGNIMSYGEERSVMIPAWGEGNLRNSSSVSEAYAFTQTLRAGSTATCEGPSPPAGRSVSNAVDHNLDTFEIWLNPLVTVRSRGATPVCYSVSAQPLNDNDLREPAIADVVRVPAALMEAAPSGMTSMNPAGEAGASTVPVNILVPQALTLQNGSRTYMPGLGAICANNELYRQQLAADLSNPDEPAEICTQGNQCGCTPADFSGILVTDPLLNYDNTTFTAHPYPGAITPLLADSLPTSSGSGSGARTCGLNLVPSSANCRYVAVPPPGAITAETAGEAALPARLRLTGQKETTTVVSDPASVAERLAGSIDNTVPGVAGDGPLLSDLAIPGMWTWTEMEDVGNAPHQPNSMMLTLGTSTRNCQEDVSLYEDTVYHTFVFQVAEENASCATPQTIAFAPPPSPVALHSSPITLSALASSGLPVAFHVVSGPGRLSGNVLTVTDVGTVVVAVTQAGDSTYAPAAPVTQRIIVNSAEPSFSVTATQDDPAQTGLSMGHSMSYSITVSPRNGFRGPVRLFLSGLPPGVSYSFMPVSVDTSGTSTLTLTSAYSISTYIGYSTLTVSGSSGRLTSSGSFTLVTRRLQYRSACRMP